MNRSLLGLALLLAVIGAACTAVDAPAARPSPTPRPPALVLTPTPDAARVPVPSGDQIRPANIAFRDRFADAEPITRAALMDSLADADLQPDERQVGYGMCGGVGQDPGIGTAFEMTWIRLTDAEGRQQDLHVWVYRSLEDLEEQWTPLDDGTAAPGHHWNCGATVVGSVTAVHHAHNRPDRLQQHQLRPRAGT